MYNFLVANGQRIAFGLGVIITAIFLINVTSGMEQFSALPEEQQPQTKIFNFGISGALALTALAAIAMLLFGLAQVFSQFRSSVKGIIGFLVLLGIFFGAYTMASGEATGPIADAVERAGGISAGNLKFIGGAISTALALIALAALAFLVSEVTNFFK
ncbi:MAG: hypothetical protein R3350_02120 [Saprospiraceae bacterium]|nr:hypothetical protein [Saprospiraceae bacterium]